MAKMSLAFDNPRYCSVPPPKKKYPSPSHRSNNVAVQILSYGGEAQAFPDEGINKITRLITDMLEVSFVVGMKITRTNVRLLILLEPDSHLLMKIPN